MEKILLLAAVFTAAGALRVSAAIQTQVPMQGGMVMPMVSYHAADGRIQVMMPGTVPQLTPLLVSNPGDSFDPANPWFNALNPGAEGPSFSRHYGFMSQTADPLPSNTQIWICKLAGTYHCPADQHPSALSYGMNNYFEVGPDDDYVDKPQTWRKPSQIRRPAATVFTAETSTGADHIMPEYWFSTQDAMNDVAGQRHREKSNYSFADGHAQLLPLAKTDSPPQLDSWNPLLAQ